MIKVTLLMAIAISTASVLAMILAPITMTTNVAKAYNCSSTASTHKGSVVTSFSGSTGSCATSSSSSTTAKHTIGTAIGPNTDIANGQGDIYTGAGGAQSSSSISLANKDFALSFSQSNPGSSVAVPPGPQQAPTTTSTTK